MPLPAGTRLGPYEILSPLGAGGMGEVYRAHDARIGRDVAIKVLPPAFSRDPEALARFQREARAVGALSHPNIVSIHDAGTHEGVSYVVMEHLEGETLRARLQGVSAPAGAAASGRHGLPKKKALEIAIQIAQGLAAAHARGIVHRDLKPENIFVTTDGRVKILDFGLARAQTGTPDAVGNAQTIAAPAAPLESTPGMVLGTVGYMSPEQVRGQQADHRADIFAFGAVLYEMLTGDRAFAGDSAIETMSTILKADPMDTPSASVHVTGALEPLLRHCLEKQPDERFQSARDLAFQLQAVASGALSTGSAAALGAGHSHARRIGVLAAIALAALAAGMLIGRTLLAPSAMATETITTSVVLPDDIVLSTGFSPSRSGGIAVSPDGRRIAFTAGTEQGLRIYVRALDSDRAIPVPGTEGGGYPAWSPDGTKLAFLRGRQLVQIPVTGGTAQVVTPITNPRSAPAWSSDDALLFHADYRGPLLRVAASGGTPVEVLPVVDRQVSWFSPVWLDARRFLVVRFHYHGRDDGSGIYAGSIDSRDLKLVVPGRISEVAVGEGELYFRRGIDLVAQQFDVASATVSGDPRVLSDRVSMVGSAGRTLVYYAPPGALSSGQRVVWLSRTGQEIGEIAPAGSYRDPRLSPDGRHLAIARANDNGLFEIWAYDLARGIDTRVTGSTFISPAWSSDGRSILAGSNAAIHRFRVGESATPERLPFSFPDTAFVSLADVAADGGTALIRVSSDGGDVQQSIIRLDGSNTVRPVGPTYRSQGMVSAFAPGAEWAITTAVVRGTLRLQAQRVDGTGSSIPVAGIEAAFPRFRTDGRELYFLSDTTGVPQVMVIPVTWSGGAPDFGVPRKLFDAPTLLVANFAFDVSADGQRFVAVVQSASKPTPLTVVVPAGVGR